MLLVALGLILVEQRIRRYHVINNIALGYLLGPELGRSSEILSVVVTEVIIADNCDGLNPSTNKKVDENRLELGLSLFEVISTNENLVFNSNFHNTRNKSVLRAAVDICAFLEDGSNGK